MGEIRLFFRSGRGCAEGCSGKAPPADVNYTSRAGAGEGGPRRGQVGAEWWAFSGARGSWCTIAIRFQEAMKLRLDSSGIRSVVIPAKPQL